MSQVKAFAVWLSSCVFQHEMSDEEIVSMFKQREDAKGVKNVEPWVREQIHTVRNNPKQYRELLGWQQGKDY